MSTTLPTTQQQAIEALKARAFADPTPAEIAAMQQKMDAEMLAAHGEAWKQRTTPHEAERAIRIERSAEYRQARDENAIDMIKARDGKAKATEPTPRLANWAQKYETVTNADKSISYVRDGAEKIRETKDSVQVLGDDRDTLRDAVRLAREKYGDQIQVAVKDEAKRDALLGEMARQGVRPQAELAERYAEIKADIEKQRAEAILSGPAKDRAAQKQHEHELEI